MARDSTGSGGYSPSLDILIEQFSKLPGVGRKSAVRLAFHVINMSQDDVDRFSQALLSAKNTLHFCNICQNLCDDDECHICTDTNRNKKQICVVTNARDVVTFERVKNYMGVYHVLHGSISPMDGIGPDKLKIKELIARAASGEIEEIILATNPTTEGEATAMYLAKLIKPFEVKTTRIAYGIPVGAEIEFADDMTLFRALEGRREVL